MDLKGKKIILASNSPRRRELLAGLNVDFTIDTGSDFEEKFSTETPHSEVPALMSEGKSLHFHRPLSGDEILITSDTMVLCDSLIMGKPHSREEAVTMLRSLSGRSHEVKTAVTMRDCHGYKTVVDTTEVEFKVLSDSEIDYYIDNFKPYDKAGAYGIQEWIGYIGITGIRGSYFNVMGFPVHVVYQLLMEFVDR